MKRPPGPGRELTEAACGAVAAVLLRGARADAVLYRLMRDNPRWTPQRRAEVAAMVHGVLRNWRKLAALAGSGPSAPAAAEVAAVVEAWIAAGGAPQAGRGLAFAVEHSLPDWLDRLGRAELGEERWQAFAAWTDREPRLFVRINTLRTDADALAGRLKTQGFAARRVRWSPDALEVSGPRSVAATEAHREGLFEVQDAASQRVARALDPRPGMRVVDGCAGAGGKTLHLAALMRNEGRILALDTGESKLSRLRARARRAGASIIETRALSSTKVLKRRKGTADRLLLDVPCSGLGVLRRNPDIKWRLAPGDLDRLRALQREILAAYAPLVRAGGRMVYATCSVLPSEGEEQVRWFLGREPSPWRLAAEERWGPPAQDSDAFYVALLERSDAARA
jgi:16S rRNA (cytosine967-C5)-methyltransferase